MALTDPELGHTSELLQLPTQTPVTCQAVAQEEMCAQPPTATDAIISGSKGGQAAGGGYCCRHPCPAGHCLRITTAQPNQTTFCAYSLLDLREHVIQLQPPCRLERGPPSVLGQNVAHTLFFRTILFLSICFHSLGSCTASHRY